MNKRCKAKPTQFPPDYVCVCLCTLPVDVDDDDDDVAAVAVVVIVDSLTPRNETANATVQLCRPRNGREVFRKASYRGMFT